MSAVVHHLFRVEDTPDATVIPPPPVPLVLKPRATAETTELDDPRQLAFWPIRAVAKRLSRRGAA